MGVEHVIHLVRTIIIDVEGKIPAEDTRNAWALVDAGEPGVALENLCTQLYEFEATLPQQTHAWIAAAGEAMGLEADHWTDLGVERG